MVEENELNNRDSQSDDGPENKYLTFCAGKEEFAIPIRYITEIIGIQHITELPEMPDYLIGVINLRGQVIPVIDIRLRFNLEQKEYNDRTCIIIVQLHSNKVGLIVDSVSDVVDIPKELIDPPPKIRKGGRNRFISGLGKIDDNVKILINTNQLLFDEDLETLPEMAQS